MSNRDLLIEIGLEEMPARFISDTIAQLEKKVSDWFIENKITFETIYGYSTPRRLALVLKGVAESQEDIHEEAKGPAKKIAVSETGEWSKAAIGFTKGQGASTEDIFFKEINGIEYIHVKKFIKGKATKEILPELSHVITNLYFPKNMRWADSDLKYVRPIKWLISLFGTELIPLEIANVSADKFTYGHRFLGERIEIDSPSDYEERLLSQFVMADAKQRKAAIVSQLHNLMEENHWEIPIDEDLLEEVNNLVEYPTVLFGNFEEEFLNLPEQVLITSMKEHQRYFPVKSKEGKLLPHFVTVRNGDHMHLEVVAKGNEKVLRARLADAAFFYNEDQKLKIEDCLGRLETIVYHEEIGTLASKVARVRKLSNEIAHLTGLNLEETVAVDRAAEICKFDLVTNLVYEFPELQGVMGEKYALQKGETTLVSQAINEHYMPRNAEDGTPSSQAGAVLAIADKLDTIAAFFAIGKIPSGSQDPYALRRQASGIVHILLEKKWSVEFEVLLKKSLNLLEEASILKNPKSEVKDELISFFKMRIKHHLQEKGIRYDLVEAILGTNIAVIPSLISRAEILENRKLDSDFKENIEALSRVLNLSSKVETTVEVNPALFSNEYEASLFAKTIDLQENLKSFQTEEQYFNALIALKPEISQFFEHTMVMVDDQNIKNNRLSLLAKLAKLILNFAKVNEILVK